MEFPGLGPDYMHTCITQVRCAYDVSACAVVISNSSKSDFVFSNTALTTDAYFHRTCAYA